MYIYVHMYIYMYIYTYICIYIVICPKVVGMLNNVLAVQGCVMSKNPFFFITTWLAFITSLWIW
jgi:hypothetical protein